MGVLKFRLPADFPEGLVPEVETAYVTGLDRLPEQRIVAGVRDGLLILRRERVESGRVLCPWRVPGFGLPVVSTATLAERAEPYDLALELARGKLNDVANQSAEWVLAGLKAPEALAPALTESRRAFTRAATRRDEPEAAARESEASLVASHRAADVLVGAYAEQVLARRLEHAPTLPTLLGCGLGGLSKAAPWYYTIAECLNAARVRCDWRMVAPEEGQFRWEGVDFQVHWCRKRKLAASVGPLLDLRPSALPHWLWLWEGDFDAIAGMVVELVRAAVARYRGRVASWHLVGRAGSGEVLGLGEEEQFHLTARALRAARQVDPDVPLVVDFDRPWADWLATSRFNLGPLHLADNLVRNEVGISGIGLEIAPGYVEPGSPMRDLLEFSKLLDLFALLNLPLHLTMAAPSGPGPDPKAEPTVKVAVERWPAPPDEEVQRAWAERWVGLAASKPFVRSITWAQATDAAPHLYPMSGLHRADGSPKPVFDWLKAFRQSYLA